MSSNYIEQYERQSTLVNEKITSTTALLIGVGGIGSPTALTLTKLGIGHLILVDPDTVELHNLPNQLYTFQSLMEPKVDALKQQLLDYRQDIKIETVRGKFDKKVWNKYKSKVDIVISGVDNIDTRKEIWGIIKSSKGIMYVDARMAKEDLQIYTVNLNKVQQKKLYEQSLFPAEQTVPIPCTERSVIYNVFVIAGFIGMLVKKIVNKEGLPTEILMNIGGLQIITN